MEKVSVESKAEGEKLAKIVKTLEEELTAKAERIKGLDSKVKEAKEETQGVMAKLQ